ncbi:MAG: sensor histidine kinase, partial [Brachymonas sp.]|nr:sensor histidine kinase [Brachymonas sp.]
VEDSGIGIPAAERQRVLDPFYRVLGTEQTGSGLGLSIVKTIAARLDGRLELDDASQFTQGLKVRLILNQPPQRES